MLSAPAPSTSLPRRSARTTPRWRICASTLGRRTRRRPKKWFPWGIWLPSSAPGRSWGKTPSWPAPSTTGRAAPCCWRCSGGSWNTTAPLPLWFRRRLAAQGARRWLFRSGRTSPWRWKAPQPGTCPPPRRAARSAGWGPDRSSPLWTRGPSTPGSCTKKPPALPGKRASPGRPRRGSLGATTPGATPLLPPGPRCWR